MTEESEADEDDEGCMFDKDDSIFDIQAGHGSSVAGMIYARMLTEAPGSVASLRQRFRRASQQWHRFLRFASALGSMAVWGDATGKRRRGPDAKLEQEERKQWTRRLREIQAVNIQAELAQLMGEDAQFRGSQQKVY